jgi:hypothetical protein
MLRSEASSRSGRRMRDTNPLVSLRSPLPLLVAGVGVTLLVIALVTLPPRPAAPDPTAIETLTQQEAKSIVAEKMRSGQAAAQVLNQGAVRFDDGTWYVSVGDAQFHFSQRNRVVVADNPSAVDFQYRE